MTDPIDEIEAALPHVQALGPVTWMPVQLYGVHGDERFTFYWKRGRAQLDVGPAAQVQPASVEARRADARRMGEQLGLPAAAVAEMVEETVEDDMSRHWIEVEPRLTAAMETEAEAHRDLVAETFLALEAQLRPAYA